MMQNTFNNNEIFGIDEVGRGAFAGPLVGACVFLNIKMKDQIEKIAKTKIKDSKKLTINAREKIFKTVNQLSFHYSICFISVEVINAIGIQAANKELFLRLLRSTTNRQTIIDGTISTPEYPNAHSLSHADNDYPAVSLASILAKVSRDRYMVKLHNVYPVYDWNTNMGYGTYKHRSALKAFGLTEHHRQAYIKNWL